MSVRRLAMATAALFLLSVLGLVTVDPDDGSSVVAAAAAATTRTGSARLETTTVSSSAGTEVRGTAAGVVDFGSQRSSSTVTGGPTGIGMRSITAGTVVYLEAKAGTPFATFAQGKAWVGFDLRALGDQLGPLGSFSQDPVETLRALTREGIVGAVVDEGPDEVRGVRTVRYSGDLDAEKLAEVVAGALGPLGSGAMARLGSLRARVSVWVSDDGLVRRFATNSGITVQGTSITSSTTTEFFDFGEPVQIDVPPPDQVRLITSLQELTGR